MNIVVEKLSLQHLIQICADCDNKNWEGAWSEFLKRYKQLIYFFINKSCQNWQISRLNLQKNLVINDIFSEVLFILYSNIESFVNKNSKQKFISWLQIICSRSTSRYMQRIFTNMLCEDQIDEFNEYKESYFGLKSWELYENVVSILRSLFKNNRFAERDIHIFLLNVWSGFSAKQILEHPCFNELKQNSVEVILSRIRKKLKNIIAL